MRKYFSGLIGILFYYVLMENEIKSSLYQKHVFLGYIIEPLYIINFNWNREIVIYLHKAER